MKPIVFLSPALRPFHRQALRMGVATWLGAACLLSIPAQSAPLATTPAAVFKAGVYDKNGNYLGLPSNSDTLVGFPITLPPAYVGAIQSVTGNVITVAGAPAWTAGQFVYAHGTQANTYYVLIGSASSSNPNLGRIYTVTANGTATLTVDLDGDNAGSIATDTTISVIAYWTLGTVFPASAVNVSFVPSTVPRLSSLQTQILIPDYTGAGVNLAPTRIYYYINSGTNIGWRLYGDATTTDHSDDPLLPDGYVIFRNVNPAAAPALSLTLFGNVSTTPWTTPLAASPSGAQDNAVSMLRPISISLNNTGLSPSTGSFTASASSRLSSLQDELLVYDNTVVSFNKSPASIYYYINSGTNVGWRLYGDVATNDHGNDLLPPGSALTIRKAASSQTLFWTNTPTY